MNCCSCLLNASQYQNIQAQNWYEGHDTPWIIALIISLVGLAINLIISNQQMKANRKLTWLQIDASLRSKNRQEWINQTRLAISDVLTQSNLLNIEYQENEKNANRQKILHEKFRLAVNQLELLLHPKNKNHNVLLGKVDKIKTTLTEHMLNQKDKENFGQSLPFDNLKFFKEAREALEAGRELLYLEWNEIQSIVEKDKTRNINK